MKSGRVQGIPEILTYNAIMLPKVFLCFLLGIVVGGAAPADDHSLYSKVATSIQAVAKMPHGLASPDNSGAIHVKKIMSPDSHFYSYRIWASQKPHNYGIPHADSLDTEFGWSPDSGAFFMTYTDGGGVGRFHVLVFRFNQKGINMIEPIRDGSRLYKPVCDEPELPNVGAIKWGPDSMTLSIAVEVPPHSNCAVWGTFWAFDITLPEGKVQQRYDQLEAKKHFGNNLGSELANADDNCIWHPSADTCTWSGLKPPPTTKLRSAGDAPPVHILKPIQEHP
jgi:hypothetical protein